MAWQQLSPADYQLWRQDQRPHRLIDVREDWEWQLVHLEGAQHLPMATVPDALPQLRQQQDPLVLLCHHGVRSAQVAAYLHSQGLGEVYNLSGGIDAWSSLIDPQLPRY